MKSKNEQLPEIKVISNSFFRLITEKGITSNLTFATPFEESNIISVEVKEDTEVKGRFLITSIDSGIEVIISNQSSSISIKAIEIEDNIVEVYLSINNGEEIVLFDATGAKLMKLLMLNEYQKFLFDSEALFVELSKSGKYLLNSVMPKKSDSAVFVTSQTPQGCQEKYEAEIGDIKSTSGLILGGVLVGVLSGGWGAVGGVIGAYLGVKQAKKDAQTAKDNYEKCMGEVNAG